MKPSALRAFLFLAAACVAAAAAAQPFPSRPITIVVPEAPGGESDKLARILAPELSRVWGQPVDVENDPARGGMSAAWRVSRSPWDAYTLLLAPTAVVDDSKNRYFASVAVVSTSPMALVANGKSRLADVAGLVKLAKAKPGALAYGAVGTSRAVGLAGEYFNSVAGVDLRRVQFGTAEEALAALAARKVDVAFVPLGAALAPVAAGKAKALAVTGAARARDLPKVPTVAESGYPGFEAVAWQGLLLPIATPKPLVAVHNADANKVLALPAVRDAISALGVEPGGGSSGRLFDLIRVDRREWSRFDVPGARKP